MRRLNKLGCKRLLKLSLKSVYSLTDTLPQSRGKPLGRDVRERLTLAYFNFLIS